MSDSREYELVVDRFEGEVVVLEGQDGAMLDLPRSLLPADLREGDVLRAHATRGPGRSTIVLTLDPDAATRRRTDAAEIIERLRARDPGGDLEL